MNEKYKTFTVLMASINRSIRKIKTEEMAEFHLKSPHVSCLYYLFKEDALTAKELCEICEEDKANVSRTIDYLETNGYLIRQNEDNKKYKSLNKVIEELAEKYGTVQEVLIEGYDDYIKCYFGRTRADAPEIDGKVFFKSKEKIDAGEIVKVQINDYIEYDLLGERV